MSLLSSFKLAGTAVTSQSQRLNAVSSNMAAANTVASSPQDVYQARKVIFEAELAKRSGTQAAIAKQLKVSDIQAVTAQPKQIYNPNHPMADENGYIYMPNVDESEEMVDMIASARSYQTNAEVMNTSKQLMLKTLQIGS